MIETREPGGFGQFPEATRMIQRDGVEVPQAAFWFVPESGRTSWPEEDGFFIVNRAALATPSAPIPTEDHEQGGRGSEERAGGEG